MARCQLQAKRPKGPHENPAAAMAPATASGDPSKPLDLRPLGEDLAAGLGLPGRAGLSLVGVAAGLFFGIIFATTNKTRGYGRMIDRASLKRAVGDRSAEKKSNASLKQVPKQNSRINQGMYVYMCFRDLL